MKKTFLILSLLACFQIAPHAFAQAPGTTSGGGCQQGYYCSPDTSYVNGVCSGTCTPLSSLPTTPVGTPTGNQNPSTPTSAGGNNTGTTCTAGSFCALAPIPGLTQNAPVNDPNEFGKFLNTFYTFLIGIGSALAVIMIVWGGLEISTQDSVSKKESGKEHIQQAIIGLILLLSPVLVFTIINPNIVSNLSTSFSAVTAPAVSSTPSAPAPWNGYGAPPGTPTTGIPGTTGLANPNSCTQCSTTPLACPPGCTIQITPHD